MSKRSKSSTRACILKKPEVGVVSENDHRVGLCLCKLCSCGNHICPSLKLPETSPISAYASNYKREYRKKQADQVIHPYQKPYRRQEHQFDGLTTMARDFTSFKVEREPEPRAKSAGLNVPFAAKTSYSLNFPNWGPSATNYERRYNERHQDPKLRAESRTAYRETFKEPSKSLANDKKAYQSFMNATTCSINLKSSDQPLEDITSYNRTFNVESTSPVNFRVQVKSRERDSLAITSGHFRTTHRDEFIKRPTYNDPRLLRKSMQQQ